MFFFVILFVAANLLGPRPPVLPPNTAEIMPFGSTAENVTITYNIDQRLRVDVYKTYGERTLIIDSRFVDIPGTYSSIFPALIGAHDAGYAFKPGDVYLVEMWRDDGQFGTLMYHQAFHPTRVAIPFAANQGR